MQNKISKLNIIALCSVFVAILLDQWTKKLAVTFLKGQPSVKLWKDVFELQYLENKGAAFGILQEQQWFFIISSILILIVAIYVYVKMPQTKKFYLLRTCLILIVSGAIGNTIDRIRFNYVIDFFYFKLINFPIFNVADIYVTVAACGLILLIMFYYKDEEIDDLFSKIALKKRQDVQNNE